VLERGAYRVELPNGHRCIARAEKNASDMAVGDAVKLAFHPYDLSRGRILG
jgi:translation initiation factor IF-1